MHGIPNDYIVEDGDIISIDVGVSYEGYHADAAFTFGIGDTGGSNAGLYIVSGTADFESSIGNTP